MYSDNARGAMLMVVGAAAFTLSDTIMKVLGGELPLFQTLLWRGLAVSLALAALAWHKGVFTVALHGRDRWLISLRTLADTVATWFFLQALYNMPIANMTAIMQALPLTLTLAGALLFGEKVGWRRLAAIGVGFIGVMMIVRPDAQGFDRHSIYALICVALVTTRDLSTRRMTRSVPSLIIALANAVLVTMLGAVGSFFEVWSPPKGVNIALLGATSALVVTGYLVTVMAMRVGELGFVTPFRYTGLVWALGLGFVVFGEWPDLVTFLGAALIVGTGLFTFFRERRLSISRSRALVRN